MKKKQKSTAEKEQRQRTRRIYDNMKQRVLNPNHPQFRLYGGKGIEICPEWLESFDNFLADMALAPEGMSLDRIDSEGDYCPENCRWANPKEQARNRKTTRFVTVQGRTQSVAEWSRETGVASATIYARLKRDWVPADAVLIESGGRRLRPDLGHDQDDGLHHPAAASLDELYRSWVEAEGRRDSTRRIVPWDASTKRAMKSFAERVPAQTAVSLIELAVEHWEDFVEFAEEEGIFPVRRTPDPIFLSRHLQAALDCFGKILDAEAQERDAKANEPPPVVAYALNVCKAHGLRWERDEAEELVERALHDAQERGEDPDHVDVAKRAIRATIAIDRLTRTCVLEGLSPADAKGLVDEKLQVARQAGNLSVLAVVRALAKGIEVRLKRPAGRNLDACLHHWEDGGPLDLR